MVTLQLYLLNIWNLSIWLVTNLLQMRPGRDDLQVERSYSFRYGYPYQKRTQQEEAASLPGKIKIIIKSSIVRNRSADFTELEFSIRN